MADINDLIAQAPGRRDFAPLGEIFNAYRQGVQTRREDEIARARRELGGMVGPDGRLDYGAAALHLLRAGDVHGAIALAHVARAAGGQAQGASISSDRPSWATVGAEPMPSGAEPRESKTVTPVRLPRLTTREQVQAVIQDARAAIAAGKDPGLVTKRMRDLDIDGSWA